MITWKPENLDLPTHIASGDFLAELIEEQARKIIDEQDKQIKEELKLAGYYFKYDDEYIGFLKNRCALYSEPEGAKTLAVDGKPVLRWVFETTTEFKENKVDSSSKLIFQRLYMLENNEQTKIPIIIGVAKYRIDQARKETPLKTLEKVFIGLGERNRLFKSLEVSSFFQPGPDVDRLFGLEVIYCTNLKNGEAYVV